MSFDTWKQRNREKWNAYCRKWRKEHPERTRDIQKKTGEKNKEKGKEYRKTRYKENREKILSSVKVYAKKNRKKITEYEREYCKAHPERNKKHYIDRRARKGNTEHKLTGNDIKEILALGCFVCGSHEDLTVAHDIPVSKKGNTNRANTFCLCRKHNSEMGTKNLSEILEQKKLPLD